MTFFFFSRLQKEKGILTLMDVWARLWTDHPQTMSDQRLWVASDGDERQTVIDMSQRYPSISYLGRQDRTQIADRIRDTDYCLMHGLFIETFGLNSLECLQAGVPVIGYAQGGTEQFLLPHTTLDSYIGETQADKLYACLYTIISQDLGKHIYTDLCLAIASRYTSSDRYETIQTSLGGTIPHDIYMYSDFINTSGLGGIESHLYTIQSLLKSKNHTVHIYGHTATSRLSPLWRLIGMIQAYINIPFAYTIYTHSVQNTNKPPRLIWLHSVTRWIGWLPLVMLRRSDTIVITYHDLGWFHPRASRVYSESDIPTSTSLSSRLRAAHTTNPLIYIAVVGKRLLISLIHAILDRLVDVHYVPSAFMIPYVRAWHPRGQIEVLGHFAD